ncbi:MAG: 2Fe-2S ferredoxin [Gammaproteobacteria bacterium]|nr:MAG: 2Fe-2S ferredoxin [Gammaproteobacteria bacterium]
MADFYQYHLFFCTNERDDGRAHCQQHDAQSLRNYAKQRVKELGLPDIRVNNSGCLNRCGLGPILVVYPEGIWYQYKSKEDIDEIIESHLQGGNIVERLQR